MRTLLGLSSLGALALFALSSPEVAAAEQTSARASYEDGGRHVEALRLGASVAPVVPAAPGLRGHYTAIELNYEGRAPIPAIIDETVIVTLDSDEGPSALEEQGMEIVRPLMSSAGLWLARDTTGGDGLDAAARLRDASLRARGVRAAIPNLYVRLKAASAFTPNDPKFPGQWFFANLNMTDAWGLTQGDPTSSILVIDTGCDLTHADLAAKMDQGRDVIDEDDDPSPNLTEMGSAHGTSCAGLASAVTNNDVGVAGACPACRLRCVRLVNGASLPISKNVEAFQFALDVDAAVVTNSWGFVDPLPVPQPLADAINQVFDHGRGGLGAPVVFAMGNDGRVVGTDELQGVRGVLGVGAINNTNESAQFTNTGPTVDLVAPTGTLTTDITGSAGEDPTDYTSLFGGTSSACPVAAGIMGLLVAAAPDKTAQELYDIVTTTTRKAPFAEPDAKGHDNTYGYGIIDPVAALNEALGITTGTGGAGGAASKTPKKAATSGCSCDVASGSTNNATFFVALGAILLTGNRIRRRRPSVSIPR